jgi:hypothetical protein
MKTTEIRQAALCKIKTVMVGQVSYRGKVRRSDEWSMSYPHTSGKVPRYEAMSMAGASPPFLRSRQSGGSRLRSTIPVSSG